MTMFKFGLIGILFWMNFTATAPLLKYFDYSFKSCRRTKGEIHSVVDTINTIFEEQDLSEKDAQILILAKRLLQLPDSSLRFKAMGYLLNISGVLQNKYGLRGQILEEALGYEGPNGSVSYVDQVIARLLGNLQYLNGRGEEQKIYGKLFSYLEGPDGNLAKVAAEAIVSRLTKDKNTILTPLETKLYIEKMFEEGLNVWTIAGISPEKFREFVDLGIPDKQFKELKKQIKYLLTISYLSYRNEHLARKGIELSSWYVEDFKRLLFNSLTSNCITAKKAGAYIADVLNFSQGFRKGIEDKKWVFVNHREVNIGALAAISLLEKELIEFVESGITDVHIDKGVMQLVNIDLENNKNVLLNLFKTSPSIQIKVPVVKGLVDLGLNVSGLYDDLRTLCLLNLPAVSGLEREQRILKSKQEAGDFVYYTEGGSIQYIHYGELLSYLVQFAKENNILEELVPLFTYFVTDFYSEAGGRNYNLIESSAEGIMGYLSSP